MKIYIINGDPVALARPRFSKNRVFDSQKMLKTVAMLDLQRQHAKDPLFVGPIHIDIVFYMTIPSSVSKKRYPEVIGSPHISNKDLDNLIKWVCDIGNSILWEDDRIVYSINAKKVYDQAPRTQFTVKKDA